MQLQTLTRFAPTHEFGLPTHFIRGYNSGLYSRSGEMGPNELAGGRDKAKTHSKKPQDEFQPARKLTPEPHDELRRQTQTTQTIVETIEKSAPWLREAEENFLKGRDQLVRGAEDLFLPPSSLEKKLTYLHATGNIIALLSLAFFYYTERHALQLIPSVYFFLNFLLIPISHKITEKIVEPNNNMRRAITISKIHKKGLISTLIELKRYPELLDFLKFYSSILENKKEDHLDLQDSLEEEIIQLELFLEHHTDGQDSGLAASLLDMQHRLLTDQEIKSDTKN